MCGFFANIYPVCFRLLLYGKYCSHVESAISLLDFICKNKEGVRLKLEVQNTVWFSVLIKIFHSHFIIMTQKISFCLESAFPKTKSLNNNFILRFCRDFCFPDSAYFVLQECSKRANNGKFTLRDLLVVPMQRVLKYPLLLQVQ